MGVVDDVVRAVKKTVDSALEQWTKVVPGVVTTGTPNLKVKIEGGVNEVPAVAIVGQGLAVGDRVMLLTHPGRITPIAIKTSSYAFAGPYTALSAATTSLTTGTFTVIGGWGGSVALDAAYFTTHTSGVWTMRDAGVYIFQAEATFASNGTGERICAIYKNGAEQRPRTPVNPSTGNRVVGATSVLAMAAGDTIEVRAYQSSGGALALDGGARNHFFSATFLH